MLGRSGKGENFDPKAQNSTQSFAQIFSRVYLYELYSTTIMFVFDYLLASAQVFPAEYYIITLVNV